MDTEKKPNENVGDMVGDLVVSGATMLANTAAKAVVSRVKKAAAKSPAVKAVARTVKKAKKSAAGVKAAQTRKAVSCKVNSPDSPESTATRTD